MKEALVREKGRLPPRGDVKLEGLSSSGAADLVDELPSETPTFDDSDEDQDVQILKQEPAGSEPEVNNNSFSALPYHSSTGMKSGWSLDYCLECDRQTSGAAYCSQACRLADLETYFCEPEPMSPSDVYCSQACRLANLKTYSCGPEPMSPSDASATAPWTPSSPSRTSDFYLQPAFDFSVHQSSSILSSTAAVRGQQSNQPSYFVNPFKASRRQHPLCFSSQPSHLDRLNLLSAHYEVAPRQAVADQTRLSSGSDEDYEYS